MARKMLVLAFIFLLALSIWVFMTSDKKADKTRLLGREHAPRMSMEEFTVFRYENHRPISTLSGRYANYIDPNTLEIFGSIQGFNYQSKKKEFFSAESATAHFDSKGLVDLVNNSQIQSFELENQVRFGYEDILLYTEYAKFLNQEHRLFSDVPVKIVGSQVELRGEKGFDYNSKTGDLKVYGPLKGTSKSQSIWR